MNHTDEQLRLVDVPTDASAAARERRDAGMQRVDGNADSSWRTAAVRHIRSLPTGTEFLAEEIREALDKEGFVTHDRRALGPVVAAARKAHLIVPVGVRPANTSNRSLKPVWRRQ